MDLGVHRRDIAPGEELFLELVIVSAPELNFGSKCLRIQLSSAKPYPNVIGFLFPSFNGSVFVYKGNIIEVVGNVIQVPVIVQVCESCPI